jgi:hypothetical protein
MIDLAPCQASRDDPRVSEQTGIRVHGVLSHSNLLGMSDSDLLR